MKFTNGYWMIRKGVVPTYPVEYLDEHVDTQTVTIYAATKAQTFRGDTLNSALFTVQISSPMNDVAKVRIIHHSGVQLKYPGYMIQSSPEKDIVIDSDQTSLRYTSGGLTVRVPKQGLWQLEFIDQASGKLITRSGSRGMAFMQTPEGRFVREQLDLGVGECVYGFGERFTAFEKKGQSIDIWNEDSGTGSELAYKNIPFYLTNHGYGVFVNHPERVSFEVASENVERVQFSVHGEHLEYFLIYGPTMKEILEKYTALTGRPPILPAWSFGLWLSTSFLTRFDEESILELVNEMQARDLPIHVFHIDCFWMKGYHWCDFQWNKDFFPNPKALLKTIKDKDIRISLWINSYISQQSELFQEAAQKGFLLKKPSGDVWQTDAWQAGMGIVDFTNPLAVSWFQEKLNSLLDIGVDCFKADFGERIPLNVEYHDKSDPQRMHNYYAFLYNQTVFKALEARYGEGGAVLFSRSATAGSQQFPVHWSGDPTASYASMAETLRGGLSLAMCGFGFWSHDIGGFEHTATPDLYKRWVAFGLLSSHSRLHGSETLRVPWVFDQEAVEVLRLFTRLKCQLMPYIYHFAIEANHKGYPLIRPMVLEFPEDPNCHYLDRQYMLGDSILVAPIFDPEGEVEYYLPQGNWTHLLTGKVINGSKWVRERYDYFGLPIFARENSIIPFGIMQTEVEYEFDDEVTFHHFTFGNDHTSSFEIFLASQDKAITVIGTQVNNKIKYEPVNSRRSWQLLLRNQQQVASISGGYILEANQLGVILAPDEPSQSMTIEL